MRDPSEQSTFGKDTVCVVTGASAGIGLSIATGLAQRGHTVVLACRSAVSGAAALQAIRRHCPTALLELEAVDLSSQTSIRAFGARVASRHPRIHVLVNNAGTWSSYRQETADGLERTWATNVLGYFLVTDLLREALQRGAPSRIVNVASGLAKGLDLGDVEFRIRPYRGVSAYAQSKQADRMLTWALARRLAGTGVVANAMHPGLTQTNAFRKGGGLQGHAFGYIARAFGHSAQRGADTALWLATSGEVAGVSGEFWQDRKRIFCGWRNRQQQEELWATCRQMTSRSAQEEMRGLTA